MPESYRKTPSLKRLNEFRGVTSSGDNSKNSLKYLTATIRKDIPSVILINLNF